MASAAIFKQPLIPPPLHEGEGREGVDQSRCRAVNPSLRGTKQSRSIKSVFLINSQRRLFYLDCFVPRNDDLFFIKYTYGRN